MSRTQNDNKQKANHRFLDEAGDTTFFGEGRKILLGSEGVSLSFSIGMVEINADIGETRAKLKVLQKQIEEDAYLNVIPSVKKKTNKNGFFFHATDDPPEVRQILYKFIKDLDCSLEIIVARKLPDLFVRKHNGQENEFYADVLSHLIKNKFMHGDKLVLNIASRGSSTGNQTLELALKKAVSRAKKKNTPDEFKTELCFNVQNHYTEPLLNIADYMCWAVQRVFERGEIRYYDFIKEKVALVVDLYDSDRYDNFGNYYLKGKWLTAENKLSPPSP